MLPTSSTPEATEFLQEWRSSIPLSLSSQWHSYSAMHQSYLLAGAVQSVCQSSTQLCACSRGYYTLHHTSCINFALVLHDRWTYVLKAVACMVASWCKEGNDSSLGCAWFLCPSHAISIQTQHSRKRASFTCAVLKDQLCNYQKKCIVKYWFFFSPIGIQLCRF